MREELLRIRGFLVMAAAIAALLLVAVAGCGGSDSTGSVIVGKVTIQTGSLSKGDFVEKANEICREARKKFDAHYQKLIAASESGKQKSQAALAKELIETAAVPDFEDEIHQIGELGASEDYAKEVGAYLNALKERLAEGQKDPLGLVSSGDAFGKATAMAKKAGLNGCAESLN
jgi:hypothetical protein